MTPAGCSGTYRTFSVISGPTAPCRLHRDLKDLWCSLWTHYLLPATAQGPACSVLLSQDPLLLAGCSGTQRTCAVISGLCAPCKLIRDPHACAVISGHPGCHCSGTCMTCAVVSGLTAPCLPLLRDPQFLWCHLGTQCPMYTAQEPAGPLVLSLYPLPLDNRCSGTRRSCCFTSGFQAPCLLLSSDSQVPQFTEHRHWVQNKIQVLQVPEQWQAGGSGI